MHYFFISYHTVLYCIYYSILCITIQYKDSIIPVGSGVSLSGQLANPHVELTSCPYIILLPFCFFVIIIFWFMNMLGSRIWVIYFQAHLATSHIPHPHPARSIPSIPGILIRFLRQHTQKKYKWVEAKTTPRKNKITLLTNETRKIWPT